MTFSIQKVNFTVISSCILAIIRLITQEQNMFHSGSDTDLVRLNLTRASIRPLSRVLLLPFYDVVAVCQAPSPESNPDSPSAVVTMVGPESITES